MNGTQSNMNSSTTKMKIDTSKAIIHDCIGGCIVHNLCADAMDTIMNFYALHCPGKTETDDSEVKSGVSDSILHEAHNIIHGARREEYGPVEESFQRVASYWTNWRGVEFTTHDVAMMMILLKVARERAKHKRDNLVDICGYADLNEQLHSEPKKI